MTPAPPDARKRKSEYDRQDREQYRRLGLCPYCRGAEPCMPGLKLGRNCSEKRAAASRAWRQRMAAEGRCLRCGEPNDTDGQYCSACRDKHEEVCARSFRKDRDAGRCCACGRPSRPDRVMCGECAEEHSAQARAHTQALQALRDTCPHDWWHVQKPKLLEVGDRGVKLLLRRRCRRCRKTCTETFWAKPERLWAFFGPGLLEDAA